jgi:hypothetical protein
MTDTPVQIRAAENPLPEAPFEAIHLESVGARLARVFRHLAMAIPINGPNQWGIDCRFPAYTDAGCRPQVR